MTTTPSTAPNNYHPVAPFSLPFHSIPGVPNFRDIGGWPITSSSASSPPQHVKTGIIFRGSDTLRITPTGISCLQDLNVKTIFDLRSKQQVEKLGVRDLSEYGMERKWTPVFNEDEYGEEKVKERYEMYASEGTEGIVQAFIEILTSGASTIHTIIQHILSTAPSQKNSDLGLRHPAIFLHCTTGNNRTGIFVALLLSLLNVPAHAIATEYALSELGLAPTRDVNVERLLKKGAFVEYGVEEAKRKCERMVGARRESMEALLEEVERRWGGKGCTGPEGYFMRVVGLSEEEVVRVKEVLSADGEGRDKEISDV